MAERLEDILDVQRNRLLSVLDDCCWLARIGDFHQAALRFAEFRRKLDSSLSAEEKYARGQVLPLAPLEQHQQAGALTEEAWNCLARSEADAFAASCGALSGAVEEHFRHERELARMRLGVQPEPTELHRVLHALAVD
jgi:hypothetical protein